MTKDKKLNGKYLILYRISGDSGVSNRGTFLFQSNSEDETLKFYDDLGSINDDRVTVNILYKSSSCDYMHT